eukprot:GHRR01014815.1.p1 GENE.GHRR01014815.1~~GHRR01014815.1.p1  ORF type:complete len:569 (+),score=141.24 GHRR01014815.1:326-2032(+)
MVADGMHWILRLSLAPLYIAAWAAARLSSTVLYCLQGLYDCDNYPSMSSWTRCLLELIEHFFLALKEFILAYGSVVGLWAYSWIESLPVLNFILLGTQWGEGLKALYPLFLVSDYWKTRLQSRSKYIRCNGPDAAQGNDFVLPDPAIPVTYWDIQLVGQLILRFDFLIRFVLALVYGSYMLNEKPVLLSLVGCLDLPDSAAGPIPSAGTSTQQRCNSMEHPFELPGTAAAGFKALTTTGLKPHNGDNWQKVHKVLCFLVEAAWLVYEEPRVIEAVINRHWAPLTGKTASVKVLEFVSTIYRTEQSSSSLGHKGPDRWERPLDTQCAIFSCGNATVVAFRGTQPANILDWFSDFSVNSLQDAGMAVATSSLQTNSLHSAQIAAAAPQQVMRMHEGFCYGLGLPKLTEHGEQQATAVKTQVYEWPPAANADVAGSRGMAPAGDAGAPSQERWDNNAGKISCIDGSPYQYIKEVLTRKLRHAEHKVYITGHSLGGALCAVLAGRLVDEFRAAFVDTQRVYLATFGQPLVGNKAYADFMTVRGLAIQNVAVRKLDIACVMQTAAACVQWLFH